MMLKNCAILLISISFLPSISISRSFIIDYPNNQFLKDGQPFRYISGSMHYARVPNYYWRDRLTKMRAAGLNAVQFYINWNQHEPYPGQYYFAEDANIKRYLEIINELGMVAIVRFGPYTCGEWENGGLPWWLIKDLTIKMRSSDPKFLAPVKRWYDVLFPMMLPYLYKNGGPIVAIQIENEYGSRPMCDIVYKAFLRDLFRKYVGYDQLLITTDGGGLGYLKCGFIPDVYPTVDFGTGSKQGIANSFAAQRTYAPRGPLVNSEFYPGWLDLWGSKFATVGTSSILQSMTDMYQMNASFNFYMFEGGTNFGYWNGASPDQPVTTTYDYDAPLTEAGDPSPKYFAIRDQIQHLTGKTPPTVPPATSKIAYGKVQLKKLGNIIELLDQVSPRNTRIRRVLPLSMEQINFPFGFVLYQTTLQYSGETLYAPNLKDRGYVILDGLFKGIIVHKLRKFQRRRLLIHGNIGQKLQILVENRGRECSGYVDNKGIMPNVTLDGHTLLNWEHCPISIEKLFYSAKMHNRFGHTGNSASESPPFYIPSFYIGHFPADPAPADAYFSPGNWTKGQYFVNGHNVGRYWPAIGPQVTLYTPKTMLKSGLNHVLLLELEGPGNCETKENKTCTVSFTDKPYLNKPVTHLRNSPFGARFEQTYRNLVSKVYGFVKNRMGI